MGTLTIENGYISGTRLGFEDHNIFTSWIFIDLNGGGCGFGGYALDEYSKEDQKRLGTVYGCQKVMELLRVLEIENWEDLKGKPIRVEHNGLGGKISKIGHLIKDQWFTWEQD